VTDLIDFQTYLRVSSAYQKRSLMVCN